MSDTETNKRVLILGGGFAGPVLALALKARNIPSTIYELRKREDKQGGNIALAPNALRVLDAVGVYDDVRVAGYNYDELHLSNPKGVELGKFLNGSEKKYHYPAIRVHRRDVREYLLQQCDREGILIEYGKRIKGIVEETDDTVTAAFEDGSIATGAFAVGCDGIHSHVRHSILGNASDPVFQGVMGLMGTVYPDQLEDILGKIGEQDTNRWPVALPRMTFGENGMFGTFPADFAGTEFGFMTTQKTTERSREGWAELEKDKGALKAEMEQAFLVEKGGSEYPSSTRLLVERAKPETLSSWPFFVVPHLDRWHSEGGRAIILGDAAHAIPPTGGQGAAMAFEDAFTLAITLARIYQPNPMANVHNHAAIPGRLELVHRWNMHRAQRVGRVHDFTTRNGELMKSSPMHVQQAAKEWAMWVSLKVSGPEAGMTWLYSYHCEDVVAALAG